MRGEREKGEGERGRRGKVWSSLQREHPLCYLTVLLGMGESIAIFSSIGCLPCLMPSVSVNSGRTARREGGWQLNAMLVCGGTK